MWEPDAQGLQARYRRFKVAHPQGDLPATTLVGLTRIESQEHGPQIELRPAAWGHKQELQPKGIAIEFDCLLQPVDRNGNVITP